MIRLGLVEKGDYFMYQGAEDHAPTGPYKVLNGATVDEYGSLTVDFCDRDKNYFYLSAYTLVHATSQYGDIAGTVDYSLFTIWEE